MAEAYFDCIDKTWPAAEIRESGAWCLRRGDGGGQRVSAATARVPGHLPEIEAAEAAMAAIGQPPLFMIRDGEEALDAALAARGYRVKDPVVILSAAAEDLPEVTAKPGQIVDCAAPLAVQREIWQAGGIGPARLAVMARAEGPSSYLLIRDGDIPAGVGFVALFGAMAMLHAVEIAAPFRRRGFGREITTAAARFARAHGARDVSVLTVEDNKPALALYESLGMAPAARYHYRQKT